MGYRLHQDSILRLELRISAATSERSSPRSERSCGDKAATGREGEMEVLPSAVSTAT
jgi:hypothetical protein